VCPKPPVTTVRSQEGQLDATGGRIEQHLLSGLLKRCMRRRLVQIRVISERAMPRAPFIVLCIFALTGAICARAQTPAVSPAATAPTNPSSASKLAPPEELQWSALGATAECKDGSFFHGKVNAQSCADRGGIRKLMQGRGQDLIR
jgi:hypothetical protein